MNLGRSSPIPVGYGVIHNGDDWAPVTPEKLVLQGNRVIHNGDPRIPVTPEKPVMQTSNHITGEMLRSLTKSMDFHEQLALQGRIAGEKPVVQTTYPICGEVQDDQTDMSNWGELLGIYSEVLQETQTNRALQDCNPPRLLGQVEHNTRDGPAVGANGCFNQNAGLQLQNFAKYVNGTPSKSIHATYKLPLTSSNPAVGNEWAQCPFGNSVFLQQTQILSSDQGITQMMPNDEFSISRKPVYNLNSPPRAEPTRVPCAANWFPFAPVTPDHRKQLNEHQLSNIQNFLIDESLRQEKDKQELLVTIIHGENHFDELLHSVTTAASASSSTSPKGKSIYEDGDHIGIDLNKTPQQRPPKRKKHRPKVVVEGKPKRTPKPTAVKSKISDSTSGKRKYVCRKGLEASSSMPQDEAIGVATSGLSSASKSCRRVLNFDFESTIHDKNGEKMVDNQEEIHLKSKPFDLNLNSQDMMGSTGFNTISATLTGMEGKQYGCSAEIQQGKDTCTLIVDNNEKLAEKSLSLATTASTTVRDHTINVIARRLNPQTATSCQHNEQSRYSQGRHPLNREGTDQMFLQANTSLTKPDVAPQQVSTTSLKEIAEGKEKRGSNRGYSCTSRMKNAESDDLIHSQLLKHDISRTVKQKNNSSKTGIATWRTDKRKFDNTFYGDLSSVPCYVASVEDSSRQVESRGSNNIHKISSSSTKFDLEMQNILRKQHSGAYGILSDQSTNALSFGNGFQEQCSSSAMQYHRPWMGGENFNEIAETHSLNLTIRTTDCMLSPSQRVPASNQGNVTRTSPVDVSVKRQTVIPASSIQAFSKGKLLPNENGKEMGSLNSSMKTKGPKEGQNCGVTIDDIICRLKRLEISQSGKKVVVKEQNAIVPYKGDDKVVPYERFEPIKSRKPRPKVDLDSETNKLWNLLMGKAGSENTETMDKEKEEWWEGEREVVRGRVDSFIARMHLVQGDRRFSQWKGSVVDSVIGVFLTQNVSDHLSSSAFMSLAAKFPLPLTNLKATCCEYEPISWIEEPDDQIIDPDGTITYPARNIRQPLYQQNSLTLSESPEQRSENLVSEIVVHYANESNSGTEEEVVSSQNSSDSFPQSTKYIRSSSDSEIEDHVMMCNPKNCISESMPKTERAAVCQQYQCHVMTGLLLDKSPMPRYQQQESSACIRITPRSNSGNNLHAYPVNSDVLCQQGSLSPSSDFWLYNRRVNGSYCSGSSEHESRSSRFSTSAEITKTGSAAYSNKKTEGIEGSTICSTSQETGIPVNEAIRMGQHQCFDQHQKDKLQSGFHFVSSEQPVNSNQVQTFKSIVQEGMSMIEPKRLDEAEAKRQTGHKYFSSEPLSTTNTNIRNARKRKHNTEKTKAFDWDSLRRQVLSKVGKKERCQDNRDSLDYEALMHADVKTISDTILERGMNNMLAERIKDFLNRLVREHGSIDLEWLRDVAADEAKDYLLSVRGLGLKSVECVRLLTLHQMAFPVDTNVGRIAVRLGWVPLQPLPESLQLHLLELYPVLESIQKYLWPRLCKLDQRTLYELHYQLITFGKVFCTKKKPNCNACPMRAECRHFASAFASARLALPWSEERSMVNTTTSMAVNEIPSVIVKRIALPPAETNMDCEAHYSMSKCEPIIEEPTTPEPSVEVSESDIEDMFSENPDEIPTIKLSFEELKMNVQTIIQEQNMEFQPGDLSLALVALDPSTASIPAPILKNASRLRTEHQVYELPDSHQLLKGMERREPDDPSPYLLAIWGPGETADSIQPPERCSPCTYVHEGNSQTVRGTLLVPCRTAMRGSFPLNGTYFQVNEMFADHESSKNPIDVPRDWLWQLPRRTVYFGTSVTSIFRGLSTEGIQYCFWRGFVCVRGFDRKLRAPRPLQKRLHAPASQMAKNKDKRKQKRSNTEATNGVS